MRILFNNIAEIATISANNQSLNYPVENVIHPFLEKRFQTTGASSTIVILFDSDQSVNCLFYGYNTMTGLTIVLKNSVDAILDTIVASEIFPVGAEYFPIQTTVRKIELQVSGPDPFYLGGVGVGVYYQMPDPLGVYTPGNTDNTSLTESLYGQTLQNYVKPLRTLEYGFRDNEGTIKKEVNDNYVLVGIGKGIYMDFYEENREKEAPMYGKIIDSLSFPYNPRRYDFSLNVQEAR